MPSLSIKRTIRPKFKAPKFTVIRSASYNLFKDANGKTKLRKTVIRKIRVNKV